VSTSAAYTHGQIVDAELANQQIVDAELANQSQRALCISYVISTYSTKLVSSSSCKPTQNIPTSLLIGLQVVPSFIWNELVPPTTLMHCDFNVLSNFVTSATYYSRQYQSMIINSQ